LKRNEPKNSPAGFLEGTEAMFWLNLILIVLDTVGAPGQARNARNKNHTLSNSCYLFGFLFIIMLLIGQRNFILFNRPYENVIWSVVEPIDLFKLCICPS
jgi:hypothetical protein